MGRRDPLILLGFSGTELVLEGLQVVSKEWEDGTFEIVPGVDEDIHTANERRLSELVGKTIGGKLHTGRSRNEQISTDQRLWLRSQLKKIGGWLTDLLKVICTRAEMDVAVLMPGYTHLQRGLLPFQTYCSRVTKANAAQPIRFSHWLLSYGMAFANDLERLREVLKRVNRSSLGYFASIYIFLERDTENY